MRTAQLTCNDRPSSSLPVRSTSFSSLPSICSLSRRRCCLRSCSNTLASTRPRPSNTAPKLTARSSNSCSPTPTVLVPSSWPALTRWTRSGRGSLRVSASPSWLSSNSLTSCSWSRPANGWPRAMWRREELLGCRAQRRPRRICERCLTRDLNSWKIRQNCSSGWFIRGWVVPKCWNWVQLHRTGGRYDSFCQKPAVFPGIGIIVLWQTENTT